MKTLIPASLALITVLLSIGAYPPPDPSRENHERRRGFCVVPIPTLGDNKSTVYQHQDGVEWVIKPIIQDGYLIAEGVAKGDKRLAAYSPGGYATFVVKRRNTDSTIVAILPPPRDGRYYSGTGHVVAREWDVSDTHFRIKARAVRISEAADLVIWGSEVGTRSVPLATHSIEVSKE